MKLINTKSNNKNPSGKTRQRQKLGNGPENITSEKLGEKIGKAWQTLKIHNLFIFFSKF
jgi:hypothetical protein